MTIIIVEDTCSRTPKGYFAVANSVFDESPVGLLDNKPTLEFMKYSAMMKFIVQPLQNNKKTELHHRVYYGPRWAIIFAGSVAT